MLSDKLNSYLQKWNLSNPERIAETATSFVYTVNFQDKMAVLKLLTEIGIADEQGGAVALKYFNGQGAIKIFDYDEGAHLLEYVAGNDLVPMVEAGDDEKTTAIIAGLLNKLHTAYSGKKPDGLRTLRRQFRSLFRKAESDKQAGIESVYRRAIPLVENLLANPQNETVLHGDIHHWNIRHHEERGWLAFDPKGVYGERTYDLANTLYNPGGAINIVDEDRILRNSKILANKTGIDHSRVLAFAFAYGCLSASWSLEDGYDPNLALTIAQIIEPHVL